MPSELSSELAAALDRYRAFLVADDAKRANVIEASDLDALRVLVATVEPLYPEINAVLDGLMSADHPLPEDLELLEVDLNSLAQAGMEAQQALNADA